MAAKHHEIQIEFVNATELKPDSKYIIVASQDQVERDDLAVLIDKLKNLGINNIVALHVPGDPANAIHIIEQEKN
jgi:methylmalonyl-CoA mutase cobalamin-binding subunit